MNRRTFLKLTGVSGLSLATGCSAQPAKTLYCLIHAPEDLVTGTATWYASTCRECPAGCGLIARNLEGRVVKLEGNPIHPINQGKLCMRGQAGLQGLYDPDRIRTPLLKEQGAWRQISFLEAETLFKTKAEEAAGKGANRVRMLTAIEGDGLLELFSESLRQWRSGRPLVFEPFAYESQKAANQEIFGINGLPSHGMEDSDFLVSFGADFLETFVSPVEYVRKFEAMHGLKGREKSLFIQVSPYQNVTCASSDLWLSCLPGGEAAVALGLIRESIRKGRGKGLATDLLASLASVSSSYNRERVVQLSGLPADGYDKLVSHLLRSRRPLALGSGTGATGPHALQTEIAVILLNLVLNPGLDLLHFGRRYRVEGAAPRPEVVAFFSMLEREEADLVLLNNVNPVYALPPASGVEAALKKDSCFVVSFSNFMDETTRLADLVLPVSLPLETWDEYAGRQGIVSTLQPAMGSLTGSSPIGDVLLRAAFGDKTEVRNFKAYLFARLVKSGKIKDEKGWLKLLERGGVFDVEREKKPLPVPRLPENLEALFEPVGNPLAAGPVLLAAPSIRFFDGRGANKRWLCEVPDPLTKVAWHTPVLVHGKTLAENGLKQGDVLQIDTDSGSVRAPVYETVGVRPGGLVMSIGQGHREYGRYAKGMGLNPFSLLSQELAPGSGAPVFAVGRVSFRKTGSANLAETAGSRFQYGRPIALSVSIDRLGHAKTHEAHGYGMYEFPLTLPLPEGYDRKRDFYPPHKHDGYRWAMVVDLDRCIGCAACTVACYAENNVGVVGFERVVDQREMSWLRIERYLDPERMERVTFLPMLCQHCDDAPCESVCPVFAPNHNKEGINNQIYNRCIGTRFCSQDCPYKVRRFNWFDWDWPAPLNVQANPDVTVRKKGVMEKCSFCVQRIKRAHNRAKAENRRIRDGEVQPACVQTCPAGVFTFGNLMDKESLVWKKVHDDRAYQVMGYLNTKPAVIYLRKVVHAI